MQRDKNVPSKKLGLFSEKPPAQETVPIVHLKNGACAPKPLVDFVMKKLASFQTFGPTMDPMAAYYLVQKCNDSNFQLMPHTILALESNGLADKIGNIPEAVKDIVLSALLSEEDKGIMVTFGDPRESHNVEVLGM